MTPNPPKTEGAERFHFGGDPRYRTANSTIDAAYAAGEEAGGRKERERINALAAKLPVCSIINHPNAPEGWAVLMSPRPVTARTIIDLLEALTSEGEEA